MQVKTSELIGDPLDWAVAACWGEPTIVNGEPWIVYGSYFSMQQRPFNPSIKWAQGGPIIDQERIDVISDPNGTAGWMGRNWVGGVEFRLFGPTPLISAMRCFVASKLGDTVEIPEELCK